MAIIPQILQDGHVWNATHIPGRLIEEPSVYVCRQCFAYTAYPRSMRATCDEIKAANVARRLIGDQDSVNQR